MRILPSIPWGLLALVVLPPALFFAGAAIDMGWMTALNRVGHMPQA